MAIDVTPRVSRILMAVCTVFVIAPAVISFFSIVSLIAYGSAHDGARGFMVAAANGIISIPLAILQIIAIAKHVRGAAALVSIACWCFFGLFLVGCINVLVMGADDETPFRVVPDGVVLFSILFMTGLAAITMGRYARELETRTLR
jgi:hypothetical protein